MKDIVQVLDRLYNARKLIYNAVNELRASRGYIDITDLYQPMGALVSIARAVRSFLDTLPQLTEFNPVEYYHSQGLEPGEFMERAESALDDALHDLTQLDIHLNQVWSAISPLGRKTIT